MGIETVAVYSEADEHSLHVRFADEAVCIGPARSSESYLHVPAIISAAEITGADAIHPGYGFLSESAYLAEAARVLPHQVHRSQSARIIRLMGDKSRARRAMKEAGVPLAAGQRRSRANARTRRSAWPTELGYPVMHQGQRPAAAGAACASSGRARRTERSRCAPPSGRRRPPSATVTSTSRSTSRRPRHIEVQVLGDEHGNVVHLGERECSVQRRHQKLIEEAPSPRHRRAAPGARLRVVDRGRQGRSATRAPARSSS